FSTSCFSNGNVGQSSTFGGFMPTAGLLSIHRRATQKWRNERRRSNMGFALLALHVLHDSRNSEMMSGSSSLRTFSIFRSLHQSFSLSVSWRIFFKVGCDSLRVSPSAFHRCIAYSTVTVFLASTFGVKKLMSG